jgi:predicted Zn-dependent peptidase
MLEVRTSTFQLQDPSSSFQSPASNRSMLKTFTLKNGIKVATYELSAMKSVFLALYTKSGSIFDSQETSGCAHFMEHILLQGTPSYPNWEVLSDYIEELAGSYNATTMFQSIRFYVAAPAKSLRDILKIGGEVFYQPLFPEEAIERERRAVLEEVHQRQDALWYKNHQFFAKVRFKKGHPMLLDGGGEEESVAKLQKADLMKYWERFFFPQNSYLILVGGFKSQSARRQIEEIMEKYSGKKKFQGFPKISNQDFSSRKIAIRHDSELKSCYIDLNFPSISNGASLEDRAIQGVIRSIMGGLSSSRLFRLLRQRRGLVYGVRFGSGYYEGFGYCNISSEVVLGNLEEVVRLIVQELSGFIKNGPTKEEVEFAKNYQINSILMQFDHPSNIADWVAGDLLWEDKIYTPEEYAKIIEKVDIPKILAFMQKYWEFDKLNLIIQGSLENSKENRAKYRSLVKDLK